MKKFLVFALIFSFASSISAKEIPKRPSLEQRQENYISLDSLNFKESTLEKFNTVKEMEYNILRPISLKLEANLLRLDEINEIKCKWYQKQCKKEVEQYKAAIAGDIKELKRQVWQKKEYFKILYINQTTRSEHYALRDMVKNITKDKMQLW